VTQEATPLVWLSQHRDVQVLRWPDDAARLDADGLACLWLVEAHATPPEVGSCLQDWLWLPASDLEVQTRLATLAARAARHPSRPTLDPFGQLTYCGRSLFLSPTDEHIVRTLVERFGEVVEDDELLERVWPNGGASQTLRVHISRLRRRVAPLGLTLTCVRGAGYILADANHSAL
jgi:hypothetical protein